MQEEQKKPFCRAAGPGLCEHQWTHALQHARLTAVAEGVPPSRGPIRQWRVSGASEQVNTRAASAEPTDSRLPGPKVFKTSLCEEKKENTQNKDRGHTLHKRCSRTWPLIILKAPHDDLTLPGPSVLREARVRRNFPAAETRTRCFCVDVDSCRSWRGDTRCATQRAVWPESCASSSLL